MDHGADVNFGGRSGQLPLYMAVKGSTSKQLQILKILIQKGAKLDMKYVNGMYTGVYGLQISNAVFNAVYFTLMCM